MPTSLYDTFVPPAIAMLGNIKAWLDKAEAQGNVAALMEARLAPDMHPLPRQIQIASDGAKGAAARLTGTEAPIFPDTEDSFAGLKARCDATIAYLQSVNRTAFDDGAGREVVMNFPSGVHIRFATGEQFVTAFAIPNFYFHTAATYAILRNQGVAVGKADYLMHLAPLMNAPS